LKRSGLPGIVLTHQPPFVNTVHEENNHENYPKATRKALLDRMVDAGVKYVLAGHTHMLKAKAYRGMQILNAETTSNNFDGRAFGFRLLTIGADGRESWDFIQE